MGSGHSIELIADADSLAEPGTRVVMTASLDDIDPPIGGQQFFEEMLAISRTVDPIAENVLKEIQVKEESPTKVTIKVILDGKKLDSYGYGKGDGTDRVRVWKKFDIDMGSLSAVVLDYVMEPLQGAWIDECSDKEVVLTTYLKVIKDPTRVEVYSILPDGTRLSGTELQQGLWPIFDAIVGSIQLEARAKVKMTPNAPSIKEKGKVSAVSEPMDEHVYYDAFFDSFLAVMKEDMQSVQGTTFEEGDGEIMVVQPISEGETVKQRIQFNQESGEINIAFIKDGKIMRQQHHVIQQSPLVMEAWNVGPDGDRTAGPSATKMLQKQVNRAIDKANSWFG